MCIEQYLIFHQCSPYKFHVRTHRKSGSDDPLPAVKATLYSPGINGFFERTRKKSFSSDSYQCTSNEGTNLAVFDSATPLRLSTEVPISTQPNEDTGTELVWCQWLTPPRSLSSCQTPAAFTQGCTTPGTSRSKPRSTPVINPWKFQHPSWNLLRVLVCLSATSLSKPAPGDILENILDYLWQTGNWQEFHVCKGEKSPKL